MSPHRTRTLAAVLFTAAVFQVFQIGPAFAQNTAPTITSPLSFSVDEGSTVVATLTATDSENDSLTWSIADPTGADGALFTLSETGALAFAEAPDYEDSGDSDIDNVYEVTVEVGDATDSTTADLEVTVEDVAPGLAGPATASHAEGKRGLRIAAYTVDDVDTWSLTGDDAAKFTIGDGFLRFVDPPDYENAADTNTDNVYNVTVNAGDGTATETTDVTVAVTNVDEPGVVALSPLKPKLGTALTATLTDPDTVSGTTTWVWERNNGREGWETIDGATEASYTPTAADGDRYLRVTATYADGIGSGKSAQVMAPHVVIARQLSALAMSGFGGVTGDSRALYPTFDADTLHYAARCTESATLTLSTRETDARLSVNGVQRPKGTAFAVTRLGGESDIRIELAGRGGESTTYTVHCIDRQEFPKLTTVKNAGAMEDLAMFRVRLRPPGQAWRSYLVIMDNNGVPRFRRRVADRVFTYFRVFPDETHPRAWYSYQQRDSRYNPESAVAVVLDKHFNLVADDVRIGSPFSNTDGHDFMVRPNGDSVLMAYSPKRRDLSFINTRFPDVRNSNGAELRNERVQDSVIQIRTAGGAATFNWNSWDHLAFEDCIVGSTFNLGYAHLNSFGWVDGDILAGFRHCSKILRIDVPSGEVVWRAGPSIYSRAEWEAGRTLQPNRGGATRLRQRSRGGLRWPARRASHRQREPARVRQQHPLRPACGRSGGHRHRALRRGDAGRGVRDRHGERGTGLSAGLPARRR